MEVKKHSAAPDDEVVFFTSPAQFRIWLEKNHAKAEILHVGYRKKATGKKSLTWQQSVDCALCFGWIDGVRHSLDDESYTIRFTPRKPKSTWSAVNIRRASELIQAGLMTPAGQREFDLRSEGARQYSYEAKDRHLDDSLRKTFESHAAAWEFFSRQPPYYRRVAVHWVMSAKREETRQGRLAALIELSGQGKRHPAISGGK